MTKPKVAVRSYRHSKSHKFLVDLRAFGNGRKFFREARRVAMELGHISPQMLLSTYREVVRPKEAQRYWQIMPVADGGNIIAFTATS